MQGRTFDAVGHQHDDFVLIGLGIGGLFGDHGRRLTGRIGGQQRADAGLQIAAGQVGDRHAHRHEGDRAVDGKVRRAHGGHGRVELVDALAGVGGDVAVTARRAETLEQPVERGVGVLRRSGLGRARRGSQRKAQGGEDNGFHVAVPSRIRRSWSEIPRLSRGAGR